MKMAALSFVFASAAWAQHHAVPAIGPASGIPQGIPSFCADASVTSAKDGAWSDAATWSNGRVPAAGDGVLINAGNIVVYDVTYDVAHDADSVDSLKCVDIAGTLRFRTDKNTHLKAGTIVVLEGATLEIGTEAHPISANVEAEVVIANQKLNTSSDPGQFGTGLIGLGTVRIHGAVKQPTFIRLAAEPHAGDSKLTLETNVSGWTAGDKLVLPDTRQLRENERAENYAPQWEELKIADISGKTITLAAPLAFDHRGAHTPEGALEFLPHVGNVSRNVVFRSENPEGTRGHAMFVQHPDVDIRYALFKDMGRTRNGPLDSTEWDGSGKVTHIGTNQIGRYPIHFHHSFGPASTPKNGYQYTLIGNAVDSATKWGITIHNTHYGLVRDNVVYDSHGAAIAAEDGTESFNEFIHNFAIRSEGSGEFAPRSGYSGASRDPGGEGAGFWLRGPNNILRDNVAANVDVYGYGLAAGALGTIRIPKFKGADTSKADESLEVDTSGAPVLAFDGNEAYGAIQTGVAIGWNGTLRNLRVWHASRNGVTAAPTDDLLVEGLVVRGDPSVLNNPFEAPVGMWFSNYAAKSVTIRDANIQGLRVGVASPFFSQTDGEPGRGNGVVSIEDSFFKNYVGVAVATAYARPSPAVPAKTAIIRNSVFQPLPATPSQFQPGAISMNYGMAPGDTVPREPLTVYGFNQQPGDNFRLFYSLDLPAGIAPCVATRAEVAGFVCKGDGK